MKVDVDSLVELAKEVETEDNIDWENLNIDESGAYNLIALGVAEQYNEEWSHLLPDERTITMLAVITKLLVENFTLNIKNTGG